MKNYFTDEDIIRFLYDEMSVEESEHFIEALCSDQELWDRYEHFQEDVEEIPPLRMEPSEEICQRILDYVREDQTEITTQHAPTAVVKSFAWNGWFASINLNALVMATLAVFVTVAAMGFAYRLRRTIGDPSTARVVHAAPNTVPASMFDFEDDGTTEILQKVRQGIEDLQQIPAL
ncbi:MAG: hypothetical protein OHK0039_36310 [Bacteroidia bacterium]